MRSALRLHAAPSPLSLVAILVLASAGLLALTSASTARSTGSRTRGSANAKGQPKCGDTITADTTLHKDLIDCPNNGIVIGANGVTLDLNGHLIEGDGTKSAECDPSKAICDSGVADDGQDHFTLMNGRVRGFDVGVLVGTTTPGKVRDSRVVGISSTGNAHLGIAIFSTNEGLVKDSSGSDSLDRHGGVGLVLGEANRIRVLESSFRNNPANGIQIGSGSRNLVDGNQIDGGKDGVTVEAEAKHTLLRSNRASHAKDDGFDIEAPTTKLTRNRAVRNRDLGIQAVRGVIDGGGNVARHNGDRRQCTHIACK